MRSPLALAASAAALLVIALPVLAYEAVSVSEGGTIKGRVVYARAVADQEKDHPDEG